MKRDTVKAVMFFFLGALLGILLAASAGCSATPAYPAEPLSVAVSAPNGGILLSHQQFWLALVSAIGAIISSTILGIINLKKLGTVHLDLNSRLSEMLDNKEAQGRAEGELDARSPGSAQPSPDPPNPRGLDTKS